MIWRNPVERLAIPLLAFTASCFLDTKPIASDEPLDEDSVAMDAMDAGAATWQPPKMLPIAAMTVDAGHDMAMMPVVDAAMMAPLTPAVQQAPPPPPTASTDAGSAPPVLQPCDAVSSYGLRAAIDVTWDATGGTELGRGTVELSGLVQVDAVDPQTHAASATFRVCDLVLPALNNSLMCGSYQLQVPDSTWGGRKLPEYTLHGTYECDAAACALRFAPLTYIMGIKLADAQGPWPKIESTSPSQFSDDDADGFAGVSVDVVSLASFASGQSACASSSSPAGPGRPTTTPPTAMPTEIGRLLLGMRAQLTASMQLAPDCKLSEVVASDAALDLRSAGCFVTSDTDPASARSDCSEELRTGIDETLPSYDVLHAGEVPARSAISNQRPSAGTTLKAVRFAPGTHVSCDQVRKAKF